MPCNHKVDPHLQWVAKNQSLHFAQKPHGKSITLPYKLGCLLFRLQRFFFNNGLFQPQIMFSFYLKKLQTVGWNICKTEKFYTDCDQLSDKIVFTSYYVN